MKGIPMRLTKLPFSAAHEFIKETNGVYNIRFGVTWTFICNPTIELYTQLHWLFGYIPIVIASPWEEFVCIMQ